MTGVREQSQANPTRFRPKTAVPSRAGFDRRYSGTKPIYGASPESLREFVGDGVSAASAESLGGHLEGGRGLLALVFGAVDAAHGLLHQLRVEAEPLDDFLGAQVLLDVGPQDD